MASGSQNMTTYNARVVTGSNSAASPAGALLLSGAGRPDNATGDTWIFLDSAAGTSTPWGIKHDQANNKIQIFGAGTNSVWTQMNTGNTYILGKVGINTESPSAKLHIYQATNNAATQHEPALRIEGKLDIYDNATGGGVANSLLNILYNGTHEYGVPVKIHSYGGDSPAIRFSKSASIDDINKEVNTSWTVGMYYNSSNAFAITRGRGPAGWGTADLMIDSSGRVGIGTTAPAYKLDISGTAHISDTTTLGSRETSTAPSALSSVDRLIITPYYHTGGPWKITSKDDASNAYLSLYYSTTETARMQHNGTLLLCNNISFTNSGTAFRGINYGTMGDNDQWRIGGAATAANAGYMELATADDGNEPIYVRQYTGVFTTVKRTLTLLDASGNTTFPGSFYFGGDGIYHSGTAATQRIIRIIDSGDQYGTGISIGAGGLALFGSGESTSTVISNLSLTAGGTETTYITSDNAIYFYSNQNSYNANMYMSMNNSQLLISGSTSGGMAHNTTNPKITFVENQSTQPVHLIYTDQDSYRSPAGLKIVGGASATPAWLEVEGNIYSGGSIHTTKAGECGLEVNNTQATNPNQGAFIVGSSGNLGIYSRKHSKWVVACDASGNVSLNGNATTATNVAWTGVTGKPLYTRSSVGTLDWGTYKDYVIMNSALAYWNGCYSGTSSNLQYCDRGRFGTIITKATTDYRANTAPASGAWFTGTPTISSSGVMEIGRYIDFHTTNASTADYDFRFDCNANGQLKCNGKLYGAVWNDFAEYRKSNITKGGYAITPLGELTTNRLEAGIRVISDTYGYAIGYIENNNNLQPVALSGRVLAYPYRNKNEYKIGDAVCSAPGGTVDIMTRDEIKEYPDRIIGIVNEIPDYDIWEPSREGGGREPIHTNGRIWIDIR